MYSYIYQYSFVKFTRTNRNIARVKNNQSTESSKTISQFFSFPPKKLYGALIKTHVTQYSQFCFPPSKLNSVKGFFFYFNIDVSPKSLLLKKRVCLLQIWKQQLYLSILNDRIYGRFLLNVIYLAGDTHRAPKPTKRVNVKVIPLTRVA